MKEPAFSGSILAPEHCRDAHIKELRVLLTRKRPVSLSEQASGFSLAALTDALRYCSRNITVCCAASNKWGLLYPYEDASFSRTWLNNSWLDYCFIASCVGPTPCEQTAYPERSGDAKPTGLS